MNSEHLSAQSNGPSDTLPRIAPVERPGTAAESRQGTPGYHRSAFTPVRRTSFTRHVASSNSSSSSVTSSAGDVFCRCKCRVLFDSLLNSNKIHAVRPRNCVIFLQANGVKQCSVMRINVTVTTLNIRLRPSSLLYLVSHSKNAVRTSHSRHPYLVVMCTHDVILVETGSTYNTCVCTCIFHCRQRMTDARAHGTATAMCTENLVKLRCVVAEICARTDKRHAYITLLRFITERKIMMIGGSKTTTRNSNSSCCRYGRYCVR